MLYHHFGDKNKPPLVLLHGGGISCWMWEPQIEKLKEDFHIIAPIIDGHDIDEGLFSTISDAADRLIAYINDVLDGHIFALCGFSLGAQIALEVLSKRPSIANFAIIESALTEPMGWLSDLALPMVGLSYGLVSKRWFARAQAKQMMLPSTSFEAYFKSSQKISKASLVNMLKSNAAYRVKPELSQCTAKTLILAGDKEISSIIASANHLSQTMPNSSLKLLRGYRHGELCIKHPNEYTQILKNWITE